MATNLDLDTANPRPLRHWSSLGLWTRFLAMVGVAALLLGMLAGWSAVQEARHQRVVLAQEGRYLVDLEVSYLAEEFQEVLTDLRFLAAEQTLRSFAAGNPQLRDELQQSYLSFATEKRVYDQIRLLGVDGQELVRINYLNGHPEIVAPAQLQPKASRYYYQEAIQLAPGQVFVSPFDLNVEHGELETPLKPVIRFLTPVIDESGQKLGLLALNYLGAELLGKMREIASTARGDFMLVNAEGQYLQAPQAEREWGWLLDQGKGFSEDDPRAWRQIKDNVPAQFRLGQQQFSVRRFTPADSQPNSSSPPATSLAQDERTTLYVISRMGPQDIASRSQPFFSRLISWYAFAMALVLVLAWVWARSATIRAAQDRQLIASEARLKKVSSLLLQAQEEERRHLSRVMHDELGQLATAIHLDLRSAMRTETSQPALPQLERAANESTELLRRLHQVATDVRPAVLDDLGLQQALESYLDDYQERTLIEVEFHDSVDDDLLDSTIKENIYRIAQEALGNIAKHAKTDRARLTLSGTATQVCLEVRDSGCGFSPDDLPNTSRLGLLGIRERVELLGGAFQLRSQPGEGTYLSVSLPRTRQA